MAKPNWDTKKFAGEGGNEDIQYLLQKLSGPEAKLVCGSNEAPRMFFDGNGQLHIVLYGPKENSVIESHRLQKKGLDENNSGHGYDDGDGIYVHVSLSPPVDKVCPCKFNPNEQCE